MTVTLRRMLPLLASAAGVLLVVSGVISGAAGPASAARNAPSSSATEAGIITTVAGGPGGPAAGRQVSVSQPCGVASYGKGLYFTEWGNDVVRQLSLSTGVLGTIAGVGPTAGPRSLSNPCAVVTDRAGNVIFADAGNNMVRVIAARDGVFYGTRMRAGQSYAVGGKSFTAPDALVVDGHGNLLVASQATYLDGSTASALVSVLAGAKGTFYGQHMVPGKVYQLAGLQCADSESGCGPGLSGDGGPALDATFGPALWGLTIDQNGNVVISDNGDNVIRVIAASAGLFYGQQMTAGDIYSIAGGGTGGGSDGLGDGEPARQAILSSPRGLVVDAAGNLVLADQGHNRIRVIAASAGLFYGQQMTAGDIYAIAGGGALLNERIPALEARLTEPSGVALDSAGNVAITDQGTNRVLLVAARTGKFYGQKMTPGDIYTIAGNWHPSYSGNGGLATHAQLSPFFPVVTDGSGLQAVDPAGLAVGPDGNIVVGDSANNVVRVIAGRTGVFYGIKMTAGDIYTVAGDGAAGFAGDNHPAFQAKLDHPGGVAVDHAGNILVSDLTNRRIRVIAARNGIFYGKHMTVGDIYTVAAGLSPEGLAVDRNGNVLIADFGHVLVLAGRTGKFYGQHMTEGDVYPLKARGPAMTVQAVAVDQAGNVVVASSGYSQIVVIAVRSGKFYGIRMRARHSYVVAGVGSSGGFSGDGGRATKAVLNSPSAVAVDAAGNLLIADSINNRIRVVAERSGTFYGVKMTVGHIYTVAGSGKPCELGGCGGYSGYGGRATSAELNDPCGVAAYGNSLVILDNLNDRVREVSG